MKQTFTVGAFGIITDEKDRVLLYLRNDYELWNLPGGAVENGETPWDCVIREVKEETGLNTEIEKLVGIYSKPERNELVFSYKCSIVSGNLELNEEAKELMYFPVEEIPSNTIPKHVERINHYYSHSESIIMEKQFGKGAIQLLKEGNL